MYWSTTDTTTTYCFVSTILTFLRTGVLVLSTGVQCTRTRACLTRKPHGICTGNVYCCVAKYKYQVQCTSTCIISVAVSSRNERCSRVFPLTPQSWRSDHLDPAIESNSSISTSFVRSRSSLRSHWLPELWAQVPDLSLFCRVRYTTSKERPTDKILNNEDNLYRSERLREMDTEINHTLHDENGTQRSLRSPRLSSIGKYPSSTYSPRELAHNGAAAEDTIKFSSHEHHSSPPATDALSGATEMTGRPSRRIRPVR